MWHTHAAMGASTVWLLLPLLPPEESSVVAVLIACAVVGSLVPDLDAIESKIKHIQVMGIKPLTPVARAINRDFGHRGLLHSLWGWVGWTLLVLPFSVVSSWLSVAAFSLGYASHLAGDACTRSGIPLLYPKRERFHLFAQRWRVITGSEHEQLAFAVFALGAITSLLERLVS